MRDAPKSREWNAEEYHRLSAPQFQWGERVLSELRLHGNECVLDAGCGTGKVTRLLLQNLPQGRVVGLDLSRNMVRLAHENLLADFPGHVLFVVADLMALPFRECFDGIFSTASFHWVLDHDALFRNLFASLKRGGWLHVQCGGGPNLTRLRKRVGTLAQAPEFSPWLGHFPEPWFFADAEGAAARLQTAGFECIETGVETASFAVPTTQEFQDYLRTFVLHRHLDLLPEQKLRDSFVRQLAGASAHDNPPWTLDYCRLNLGARKPG